MANHDIREADKNVMQRYMPGQLLILNFEFHDIECLDEEVDKVTSAFENRGFRPHRIPIPMKDPSNTLEEKLRELLPSEDSSELVIIYYNGHGGLEKGDGLVLAR